MRTRRGVPPAPGAEAAVSVSLASTAAPVAEPVAPPADGSGVPAALSPEPSVPVLPRGVPAASSLASTPSAELSQTFLQEAGVRRRGRVVLLTVLAILLVGGAGAAAYILVAPGQQAKEAPAGVPAPAVDAGPALAADAAGPSAPAAERVLDLGRKGALALRAFVPIRLAVDEEFEILVEAFDARGQPLRARFLPLRILGPDGQEQRLRLLPAGSPGRFSARRSLDQAGRHRLEVTAPAGGERFEFELRAEGPSEPERSPPREAHGSKAPKERQSDRRRDREPDLKTTVLGEFSRPDGGARKPPPPDEEDPYELLEEAPQREKPPAQDLVDDEPQPPSDWKDLE